MKTYLPFLLIITVLVFTSCTSIHKSTKQPHSYIELEKSDFTLSEQQSAQATSVTILGIDFQRLFLKKTGSDNYNAVSIPVVGQFLQDQTTGYAMYRLLEENDDADFIFYPQVEQKNVCPILGICLINRISTVEVKAKLGTFK